MGKERKLYSKDEFLLTIIKLRLGLQTMDLAIRFNVSKGHCSNIFLSWLRAMTQMTPVEVNKTSTIAKVRILVEQIIRRIKTFKILVNDYQCRC